MNIDNLISAFTPEWHTEFNYKVKSIKRLYPGLIRKHKLGNAWLNEEDVAMLESDLEEMDRQAYIIDWNKNFNSYNEQSKANSIAYYELKKKMVASFKEKKKHPLEKKLFDVPDKPFSFFDPVPGLYTDFLVFNAVILDMTIACEPQAILVNDDLTVDILSFNPKKNNLYRNKLGHVEFMKFPVDHMINGYFSAMSLRSTLCAMALNMSAPWVKIGKILDISQNTVGELPFKQWEVEQMVKYYHIMKDIDYSKRFSR